MTLPPGAAVDKVRALETAGVVVTDSPAKIGSEMLKVSSVFTFACDDLDRCVTGYESSRFDLEQIRIHLALVTYVTILLFKTTSTFKRVF